MSKQPFFYGGQAVIEGVMIRGQRFFSLAVRKQDGSIHRSAEALGQIYTGPLRRMIFTRGILILLETLILGFKVLTKSARIALESEDPNENEEPPGWTIWISVGASVLIGVGLFFLLPLFAARSMDSIIDGWVGAATTGDVLSNLLEGLIRLIMLVGYISLIGMMKDIKRVFAYHGAEHMTIHAYENNLPLDVDHIRPFPTAHPRCGTAFLLTVAMLSIIIFAMLGRPDLQWAIMSRVLFIPVIASISYEFIRFNGAHPGSPLTPILSAPGLLLQKLTTKRPDDDQIEVAIHAMQVALAADNELPLNFDDKL
ncbi:DUF1385 domain-containing protein [SAR202 cluster bacterium AC-409-J13_OGT_754m]|nr:DUF1385 domain-containing protein [SAR202 cluster bacterium AC-409-J13_OGT_754m]